MRVRVPPLLFMQDMLATADHWDFPTLDIASAAKPSDVILPWIKWGENKTGAVYPGRATHFYAWDFIFSAIQKHPEKLIHHEIAVTVEPNFSTWDEQPRIEALWCIYRKRKIARWWASKGVKLVVDLNVSRWLLETGVGLWGVPQGWPSYATRCHADTTTADLDRSYKIALQRCGRTPDMFLVFGGGREIKTYSESNGWYWSKARTSWRNRDEMFETKRLEMIERYSTADWPELPWSPQ